MNAEELHCVICFEIFDNHEHCPRMLPTCGHSLCTACLHDILKQNPFCPMCKSKIVIGPIFLFPINYSLKSLAETYRGENPNDETSVTSEYGGHNCPLHDLPKEFQCETCCEFICSTCGMTKHRNCRTVSSTESLRKLKIDLSARLLKDISNLNQKEHEAQSCIRSFQQDIAGKMTKIGKWKLLIAEEEEQCLRLQEDGQIITTTISDILEVRSCLQNQQQNLDKASNFAEVTKIDVQIEKKGNEAAGLFKILTTLSSDRQNLLARIETQKDVYVVYNTDKNQLWSLVERIDGKIFINSPIHVPPPLTSRCIQLEECMDKMTDSKTTQKNVFIRFSSNGENLGTIIIRTNQITEASKIFYLLCSGSKGFSFINSNLLLWNLFDDVCEFVYSPYMHFPMTAIDALCSSSELEVHMPPPREEVEKKWTFGEVASEIRKVDGGLELNFWSCTVQKTSDVYPLIPIGVIEEGYKLLGNISNILNKKGTVTISQCGIVLNV